MRRPAMLAMLLVAGCAVQRAPYHSSTAELFASPLPAGETVQIQELRRTDEQSIHLVRLRGALPLHRHDFHDETVVVLRGKGKVQLGDELVAIGPGSVLLIPAGVLHSVEIEAGQEAAAVSIFVPPFDGKDRVEPGRGPEKRADPFKEQDKQPVGTEMR